MMVDKMCIRDSYCALIPIHSRTPLQPGDLRGDLTALPDMLAVEEM